MQLLLVIPTDGASPSYIIFLYGMKLLRKIEYVSIGNGNFLSDISVTEGSIPFECHNCTSDKVRIRVLIVLSLSMRRRW